ncbi:MAG: amino acid permease [Anaerolinea sp.]
MSNQNPEQSSSSRVIDGFIVLFLAVASIGIFTSGLFPYAALLGDFPGTNITLALIVALVSGILLVYIYSSIGAFSPHHGADYVLMSRVLTGSLGFAASFTMMVGVVMLVSGFTGTLATVAFPIISKTAGITANASFSVLEGLNTPTGVIIVGSILIVLAFIVSIFPVQIARNILRLGFFLTLLSWAGLLFQLAAPIQSFADGWNTYMGFGAYDRQLFIARQLGLTTGPFPNAFLTLGLIIAVILFVGIVIPVWMAKEVKKPQQDLLFGNLGAVLIASALFIMTSLFLLRLVPVNWLAAQSYIYLRTGEGSEAVYPWLFFYANILRPNPTLAYLFLLGWLISTFNLLVVTIMAGSRMLLAWSKDKILPVSLSFKHPSLDTPVVAVLWMSLLLELGVMLFALTHTYSLESIRPFFFVIASGQIISAVALAVYPLKNVDAFQKASGPAGWRIGNIPLVSLAGLIWVAYGVYLLNYLALSPRGFELRPFGWIMGTFAVGFALYWFRKNQLMKQGINLEMIVSHPPEE